MGGAQVRSSRKAALADRTPLVAPLLLLLRQSPLRFLELAGHISQALPPTLIITRGKLAHGVYELHQRSRRSAFGGSHLTRTPVANEVIHDPVCSHHDLREAVGLNWR